MLPHGLAWQQRWAGQRAEGVIWTGEGKTETPTNKHPHRISWHSLRTRCRTEENCATSFKVQNPDLFSWFLFIFLLNIQLSLHLVTEFKFLFAIWQWTGVYWGEGIGKGAFFPLFASVFALWAMAKASFTHGELDQVLSILSICSLMLSKHFSDLINPHRSLCSFPHSVGCRILGISSWGCHKKPFYLHFALGLLHQENTTICNISFFSIWLSFPCFQHWLRRLFPSSFKQSLPCSSVYLRLVRGIPTISSFIWDYLLSP